jgi:hypothetical protein
MDEKRFDVDGTYNARYEVVKKRIDKANKRNNGKNYSKEKLPLCIPTITKKQNT